jgi:glycosyltransferase involved in cell wall biosynthesis
MMKLLEFVEAAATGVGRHVIDLSEGLLARGHEVHLLYSGLRSDNVFVSDLHRIRAHRGLHLFHIPMQRKPSWNDVAVVGKLRRYLRRNGPFDLVHCHSTKAGLIGRLGLLGHSVKRLYTPHMFFSMDPLQRGLGKRSVGLLEAGLSKICNGVIVVSSEEYKHAVELGIEPGKLCLIRNGTALDQPSFSTPDRATNRRNLGLDEADVCVGFVGRLVPQKSPETMLRSFAALVNRVRIPPRLIIVGDGPLSAPLRRLAAELGIGARVIWLGQRDARTLMNAFDVLALTSDSEGHSLVVLEAMARGLPIVSTCVGGISETVRSGANGFVAPIRGVHEIAGALETLVNDPALRSRMGDASIEFSLNFSIDRMVDQTVALYGQVISGTWKGGASVDLKLARLR